MSETDSSDNPSKPPAAKLMLPFPRNPLMVVAPFVLVFLLFGWLYFSGTMQLWLGLRELSESGHEEKAIEYLTWAISSNPKLAQAYAERATAKMALEQQKGLKANYADALNDIARALKLAPKNTQYAETRIKIDEAAHKYSEAIAGYQRLIDLNDHNHESYLNKRAGVFYLLGFGDSALADRAQIIKIDTAQLNDANHDKKLTLEERAFQYVFLGEIDKAISDYEECAKIEPNPDDFFRIGYLYEHSGRPAEAIKAYSQLIKMVDSDDEYPVGAARFRRGNLYLKAGDNESALADADHLLKFKKNAAHHAFHIKVLDSMKNTAAADAERKSAVAQLSFAIDDISNDAPNDLLARKYVDRADFYSEDQQWKRALKDYSIALSLHPDSPTLIACAHMYTKLGDYDKAIEFFNKALSPDCLDYFREEAYSGLAEVHLLQHKPELAVADATNAIVQGAEIGAGSYWRAKAYKQLGQNNPAKIDEQQSLGLGFLPVQDLD